MHAKLPPQPINRKLYYVTPSILFHIDLNINIYIWKIISQIELADGIFSHYLTYSVYFAFDRCVVVLVIFMASLSSLAWFYTLASLTD